MLPHPRSGFSFITGLGAGIVIGFCGFYMFGIPNLNQNCDHYHSKQQTDKTLSKGRQDILTVGKPINQTTSQNQTSQYFSETRANGLFETKYLTGVESLQNNTRILCWVMTSPENHKSRAIHIQRTWGKHCNKLLFVSEKTDGSLPILQISVEHGREHLTAKTMQAFDHIYEDHFDEADWFLKADDDTYVIVENLRYFLSSQNTSEPVYFGHHFKVIVAQGYFSGGGGYVLSKEALRRFGTRKKNFCIDDTGAEDVEIGRCMEKLGVKTGDSRDMFNRSRFHCFNPETHIHGGYPDWYFQYDKYGAKKGMENISNYAITFHYVSVEQLYNLEFYTYHLQPYGAISGFKELNKQPHKN